MQDLPLLESTQLALETVVASVFDGPCESADRNSPEVHQAFHAIQGSPAICFLELCNQARSVFDIP